MERHSFGRSFPVSSGVWAAIAAGTLGILGGCQGAFGPVEQGPGSGNGGASASGTGGGGPVNGTGGGGPVSGTGGSGPASGTAGGGGSVTGAAGGTGTGGSGAGGTGTGGTAAPVVFAPSAGAYRRLTASAFRNSLRDLLGGPVTIGDLEPDSWSVGGLASVSAATVSVSPTGVERYQTAIEAATVQAFADTTRRNRLLGCTPRNATDMACFQTFVTSFGRLAWRQPLTSQQVSRYATLIANAAATLGDVYEGMRAGMNGLLLSTNFLYRLERGAPSPNASNGFWQYTSREVATRLSYFLTNSTPDATLLTLADQDALQTKESILAQADRLLATPAGRESVGNFANELYQLQIIGARAKDPAFTEYTPALQAGMMQEIPAMFQSLVFDRNASALELLTTRNTFVTRELAALYGLPTAGLSSTTPTAVTLPADGLRAGLLGTAAFLSLYANQAEGSPTLRGKFIREVLLCQSIPSPPPNVDTKLKDPPAGVVYTKRQKLEIHQTDSCAVCHRMMDPLGLTLENFDAIGKYRTNDHGLAIDVSGDLDGTAFSGPIELGRVLAARAEVADCLVRNMYRYASGHVETRTEQPVLEALRASFRAGGYRVRDLMRDIVASDGFRFVAPASP